MPPKFPVIDGHIDTLMSFASKKRKFSERSEGGQCDYPRMRDGNIQAALFAIFPAKTKRNIIKGLDDWFQLVNDPVNKLYHVKTIGDFEIAKKQEKIGAVLHFEGAGGIDKDLQLLRISYQLGLRTLGLSWSNVNRFVTGVLFREEQRERGLTNLGVSLMEEAQRLGITIDVSHLNDLSFWDVIEHTKKPIMATHSNSRAINNHLRNLTDDQIRAIQETGGTVGINFGIWMTEPGVPLSRNENIGFDAYKQHIDHIVEVADMNTVAMGSDNDGTHIPKCLNSADKIPAFFDYLLENGYSEQDLQKLAHENLLRVLKATWKN